MVEIFIWCAITGGAMGMPPTIIDCYDTKQECIEDLEVLECARCYTHYNKTVCPAFGVQVWD